MKVLSMMEMSLSLFALSGMMVFQCSRAGWLRSMAMTLPLGASSVVRSQKRVPSLSMGA